MNRTAHIHRLGTAAPLRCAGVSEQSDQGQDALALKGQALPKQCSCPFSYQRS